MSSYQDITEGLLRTGVPLNAYLLQSTKGTSATQVFILNDVFKAGSASLIQGEFVVYHALEKGLGTHYQAMLPRVALLKSDTSNQWVMEIEWLGESLLSFIDDIRARLSLASFPNLDILQRLDKVNTVIEQALLHLETIFDISHTNSPRLLQALFQELIRALKVNQENGGLAAELEPVVEAVATEADRFLPDTLVCLCHRDLTVDNIYFRHQDNPEENIVKFGDPRILIPFLEADKVNLTAIEPGWGCLTFDLAALWVSLYREEQQLQRINQAVRLAAYERVQQIADHWIQQGRFSKALLELSLAAYFSLYVGCKCDYCTAPERKWLYQLMVAQYRERIHSCAKSSK